MWISVVPGSGSVDPGAFLCSPPGLLCSPPRSRGRGQQDLSDKLRETMRVRGHEEDAARAAGGPGQGRNGGGRSQEDDADGETGGKWRESIE